LSKPIEWARMVRGEVAEGGGRVRDESGRLLDEYERLFSVAKVLGIDVSDEREILRDILDQHPEYAGFGPGEEVEMEDGTTMNPRLHIAVETVVQSQLAKDEPPEARQTYVSLLSEGMDPHEARHTIGRIFTGVVWLILENRLTADAGTYYRNKLRDLKRQKLVHKHWFPR